MTILMSRIWLWLLNFFCKMCEPLFMWLLSHVRYTTGSVHYVMNRPYRHTVEGAQASFESKMLLIRTETVRSIIRFLRPLWEIFFETKRGNFMSV